MVRRALHAMGLRFRAASPEPAGMPGHCCERPQAAAIGLEGQDDLGVELWRMSASEVHGSVAC
jgi:hypothetical protein